MDKGIAATVNRLSTELVDLPVSHAVIVDGDEYPRLKMIVEHQCYNMAMVRKAPQDEARRVQVIVASGCTIHDGKVLLIRRDEPDIPEIHDKWEFPGGKIEFGENPASTVQRELLEETGTEVDVGAMLPFPYVAMRRKGNDLLNALVFCYRCTPRKLGNLGILPAKVAETKWVDLSEIDPLRMQAGTLQFLLYQMQAENINLSPEVSNEKVEYISLQSVDQENNRFRTYQIVIVASLSTNQPFQVQCSWGRLNKSMQTSEQRFSSREEMVSYMKAVLAKRRKHHYTIVKTSPGISDILPLNTRESVDDLVFQRSLF